MNFQLHMGRVNGLTQRRLRFYSPFNGGDDVFVTTKSIANKKNQIIIRRSKR